MSALGDVHGWGVRKVHGWGVRKVIRSDAAFFVGWCVCGWSTKPARAEADAMQAAIAHVRSEEGR